MNTDDFQEIRTGRREIYDGVVVHLTRDTVRLPSGGEGVREVVWHRGAVCVVPLTESGEVILVGQYRYAMGQFLWEIPAGKLEAGETGSEDARLAAARRELAEETGFTAAEMIPLGDYYGSPAILSERITMYLATGLTAGEAHPDEDEFLRVRTVSLEEAAAMALRGELPDGKTQAGVLRALHYWNEKQEKIAARERAAHGGRYDAILWDLDGTLTDPGLGITNSVAYALRKMGRPVPPREALYRYIGPPLLDSFAEYEGMTPSEAREALRIYREYFAVRGIFENEPYPGVREMLESLCAAGERLYLATSKPEVFARRILSHFDLARYFRFVGGSDMAETRATKSAVIAYVIRETGIDPARSLMVGDRAHDVRGAHENGLPAAGVLWGYGSREELADAGADALWENPAAAYDFLRGEGSAHHTFSE